jgi:hypothetical protein
VFQRVIINYAHGYLRERFVPERHCRESGRAYHGVSARTKTGPRGMEKGEHGITFPLDVILSSPSNKGAIAKNS